MRAPLLLAVALLLVAGTPACDSESDDVTNDDLANLDFDTASFDDRKRFMEQIWFPEMERLFQEFDATEYANFGCSTCHGTTADDGTFEMPNVDHMLSFSDFPDRDSSDPREARFAAFMMDTVLPTATTLLKREPFDPMTGMGFGCTGCHPAGP